MLTILFALSSFTHIQNIKEVVKTSTVHNNSDQSNFPNFILLDNEKNELFFSESERSEVEIETDCFLIYSFQQNFLKSNNESEPFSDYTNFIPTNQYIHLYDLFCNWKLHID